MGGKNDAPPPPDYTPIAAASEAAAKYSFDLGKEQLAWAREQYKDDSAIRDKIVGSSLERQAINDENAAKDRARYEQTFQPLENQLAKDAEDFASPSRADFESGRAQATVAQQFDQARQSAAQNLESFGVDPSSTRYAALDAGSRIAQAASQAAAGNNARAQTEAMGRALRSEAINVGRGYPGQIAQTYGTSLQSGNTAMNSQLATTASGANTMGTGLQYQGAGNQALGTWGNTLNTGYQNQLAQYQANQQSSSGIGGLLGAGLGLLGTSTEGTMLGMMLEDGGAIPDGMTSGGGVPGSASPTGGRGIDDVPARLTAGEFVVPKDVVSWKGEEFFQKLIDGSRKMKPQATAQPQYAALPEQAPTFTSRPRGALPTG